MYTRVATILAGVVWVFSLAATPAAAQSLDSCGQTGAVSAGHQHDTGHVQAEHEHDMAAPQSRQPPVAPDRVSGQAVQCGSIRNHTRGRHRPAHRPCVGDVVGEQRRRSEPAIEAERRQGCRQTRALRKADRGVEVRVGGGRGDHQAELFLREIRHDAERSIVTEERQ